MRHTNVQISAAFCEQLCVAGMAKGMSRTMVNATCSNLPADVVDELEETVKILVVGIGDVIHV